jgi:hypothetical protein
MLQRCDTESIILGRSRGEENRRRERGRGEGGRYMPNRQNHTRMNHTYEDPHMSDSNAV